MPADASPERSIIIDSTTISAVPTDAGWVLTVDGDEVDRLDGGTGRLHATLRDGSEVRVDALDGAVVFHHAGTELARYNL